MKTLFCIFLVLASIVCLATLVWIIIDIILAVFGRKKKSEEITVMTVAEKPEEEIKEEPKEAFAEKIIEEITEEIKEKPKEEIKEKTKEEPKIAEETVEEILIEMLEEEDMIPETIVTNIIVEHDVTAVDVVDIVWQEHIGKNKTYRYAPNGFEVGKGDIVLVPTFSSQKHGEIARKATLCSDIYKIDPAELQFKLKPILRIIQKVDK